MTSTVLSIKTLLSDLQSLSSDQTRKAGPPLHRWGEEMQHAHVKTNTSKQSGLLMKTVDTAL
jgi:hypothetical protein